MKTLTALILVGFFFTASAQRVKFQDPDLKFSFRKPKSWQTFDNQYVIKISPSAKDTSTIYLCSTYFAPPMPMDGILNEDISALLPTASVANRFADISESNEYIRLFKRKVKWKSKTVDHILFKFYQTTYLGQKWEVVTAAPIHNYARFEGDFEKAISSLRAKANIHSSN